MDHHSPLISHLCNMQAYQNITISPTDLSEKGQKSIESDEIVSSCNEGLCAMPVWRYAQLPLPLARGTG